MEQPDELKLCNGESVGFWIYIGYDVSAILVLCNTDRLLLISEI
jgi:hypothetical protein